MPKKVQQQREQNQVLGLHLQQDCVGVHLGNQDVQGGTCVFLGDPNSEWGSRGRGEAGAGGKQGQGAGGLLLGRGMCTFGDLLK